MKICGIVTEYNPFHNGHLYHIEQARKLSQCDVLIAVMSGNYVQRGQMAIIDKHTRAHFAVQNGVDIVLELPYIYATQSASKFAKGAIDILKMAKVDTICFGSETNNLVELQEIANTSINIDNLKELMNTGNSFPKAYGLLSSSMASNDILAVSYLKALKDTNIKAISIQRTNNYHDETLTNIASAKAIRKAIYDHEDVSIATAMPITYEQCVFLRQFFPLIKQKLLTSNINDLKNIFLFSEGIENHLIKQAKLAYDFDTFINNATTRRYTTSRICRCLIHMLNNITKEDVNNLPPLDTIKVLAFNDNGQKYLKQIKKDVKIASNFSQYPKAYAQMELKTTYTYVSYLPENIAKKIIEQETKGAIKI